MALTTSRITGRVPLPSNEPAKAAQLSFALSGWDAEGSQVLAPGKVTVTLEEDGSLPADFVLWRNAGGARATHYQVSASWSETERTTTTRREAKLGRIQIGSAASYSLAELLLAEPPAPAQSWWTSLTQDQYDTMAAATENLSGFTEPGYLAAVEAAASGTIGHATAANEARLEAQAAAAALSGQRRAPVMIISAPAFDGAVGGTVTGTLPSGLDYTAYTTGDQLMLTMPAHNQGAFSVNINGIGALPMRINGGGDTPAANMFLAGRKYLLLVDSFGGTPILRQPGEALMGPTRPEGDSSFNWANTIFVSGAVATLGRNLQTEMTEVARYPNAVPQGIDDCTATTGWVRPTGAGVALVTRDGHRCHQLTQPPGTPTYFHINVPRSGLPGAERGTLSASCLFEAEAATGTAAQTRVLLMFWAGASEITAARQSMSLNTNGAAVAPLRVSFQNVAIPAGCDSIRLVTDAQPGSGATAPRRAWVRDLLVAAGSSALWRRRTAPEARLLSWSHLPDLPGSPAGLGFTATGLDRIGSGPFAGCWVIGSDGRQVEGDGSPFAARIAIVTADFQRCLVSYGLSDPALDGVQGVAWDGQDNSFWLARPGLKRIEHYSAAGAEIAADRILLDAPGWAGAWSAPNGLAWDAGSNQLFVSAANSATAYRITKAGAIQATLTLGTTTPDHLCHAAAAGMLYASSGSNGSDGAVHGLDLVSGAISLPWPQLTRCQAIEGIWVDHLAGRLFALSDGGFHTNASPALNIGLTYAI
ncbi:hypothetical protein HOY34_14210 [Xinfangfangia sp. D13-10-4-6]|uniref:hypothetical protein n=1 Tax=Pseudogemmobacter hezensis TaxID=2737662 RepID=UPI001556F659|nr:hypothetical protein [Pseudogemmobacter hezensis]NPD16349.1 hypothetical protein [Pseudogemmobacter hezensis]